MGEQGVDLGKEQQVTERDVWQTQRNIAQLLHVCQVIIWVSFEWSWKTLKCLQVTRLKVKFGKWEYTKFIGNGASS